MVYLIALAAALIAAFLNDRMTPKLRNAVLIALCVYIILIFGFRYKVGVDTIGYMRAYKKVPTLDSFFTIKTFVMNRFEPGFLLICSICKTFTKDFWLLQMVMATITNGCIFLFLHRYCKNVFIGVLMYFLFACIYFSTEVIRESAAVGIFLLNYRNLQEKKWLNYYIVAFITVLFHYSAAITMFFPLVRLLKSNIIFYIMCAVFIGITPLVERLNEMLQIASIYGRIDQYTSGADDLNMNWRIAELIRSAFPAIATLIGYRIIKTECEFRPFILLQILFCMGAFAIPIIFSRFTNYTILFVVVGASNILSSESLKVGLKAIFLSFILLTQINYYYVNYDRWVPYISIFYPQDLAKRQNIYRHDFLPWLKFSRGW